MAPLRSSRSNRHLQYDDATRTPRRQGGVIDHDPTEGLPVRKWEQQYVTIKQNPKSETDQVLGPNPDYPWPELPLPKDFHQLPPHSQEMLRRARMGNREKQTFSSDPRAGVPEEDQVMEDSENKPAVVEEDRSYTVRRWAPARVEKPDVKYLADRRPGLPPLYGVASYNEIAVPAKKMVKVRTTDSVTGQQRIYDTMILEGGEDGVDGEIITEEEAAAALAASNNTAEDGESAAPAVVAETLAPGTVIEGVGVVNEEGVVVAPSVTAAAQAIADATPVRRRPPPPKRKKHGPGRGRKKKVMFAPGEGAEVQPGATSAEQPALADGDKKTDTATDDATQMNLDGTGEDREDSNLPDEGDGDEDEEDEEEGSEEGEIEEDGEEGQMEDVTQHVTQEVKAPTTIEPVEEISGVPETSTTAEPQVISTETPAFEAEHPSLEESVATSITAPESDTLPAPPTSSEPATTTKAIASPPVAAEAEIQGASTQDPTPPVAVEEVAPETVPTTSSEGVSASVDNVTAPSTSPPKIDSTVPEMDLLGSLEQTLGTEEDEGATQRPNEDDALTATALVTVEKDDTLTAPAEADVPSATEAIVAPKDGEEKLEKVEEKEEEDKTAAVPEVSTES